MNISKAAHHTRGEKGVIYKKQRLQKYHTHTRDYGAVKCRWGRPIPAKSPLIGWPLTPPGLPQHSSQEKKKIHSSQQHFLEGRANNLTSNRVILHEETNQNMHKTKVKYYPEQSSSGKQSRREQMKKYYWSVMHTHYQQTNTLQLYLVCLTDCTISQARTVGSAETHIWARFDC